GPLSPSSPASWAWGCTAWEGPSCSRSTPRWRWPCCPRWPRAGKRRQAPNSGYRRRDGEAGGHRRLAQLPDQTVVEEVQGADGVEHDQVGALVHLGVDNAGGDHHAGDKCNSSEARAGDAAQRRALALGPGRARAGVAVDDDDVLDGVRADVCDEARRRVDGDGGDESERRALVQPLAGV